jgi:hypothetical protein
MSAFFSPNAVVFQQQPTSSSLGMGRAGSNYDTQSLILGPVSTPTPSVDGGRDTPATNNNYGASLSSLRDMNNYQMPSYTTTMPRGQ